MVTMYAELTVRLSESGNGMLNEREHNPLLVR